MSNSRPPQSPDSENPFESGRSFPPDGGKKKSKAVEFELDDEDLDAVRTAPSTTPPPPVAAAPSATSPEEKMEADAEPSQSNALEDGDEFSVRSSDEVSESRSRRNAPLPSAQQRPLTKLDSVGKILAWLVVPALLIGIFYTILKKQPVTDARVVKTKVSLPIEGSLVKITEVSSGWRDRKEGDRVSPEAQVITKATVYPTKLPQLKLKIASTAANAFVRVLFLNSEGKIAGDPRVIKVVNGKLQAGDKSDQIIGDNECILSASTGLQTDLHLVDYLASDKQRWSVELSESSNYQAKGDDWKPLETFAIADIKL